MAMQSTPAHGGSTVASQGEVALKAPSGAFFFAWTYPGSLQKTNYGEELAPEASAALFTGKLALLFFVENPFNFVA